MSPSRANRRGIIAILVGTAAFVANDAIVKVVATAYPLGEVLFLRGLMTCTMVGIVLVALGHLSELRLAFTPLMLARSAFEALATLFFTSALIHMPLAELSSITLISPLIITALSIYFYKESVGWRRWTAIAVGFIGTLFVVKPTPSAFDAWALLGLMCAFSTAGRDLITRRLPAGTPSIVVSFMSAVTVTSSAPRSASGKAGARCRWANSACSPAVAHFWRRQFPDRACLSRRRRLDRRAVSAMRC